MWLPSAVADYHLTGDADARRRGLHAAQLLAGRFNPAGYIRAWNDFPTRTPIPAAERSSTACSIFRFCIGRARETNDPRF